MLATHLGGCTRDDTKPQHGTTMLDTNLCSLDVKPHIIPARDHHVRYPPGCPGHVKRRDYSSGTT
eukprot:8029399-Pyramimonas_sp.AAC.1